MRAERLVVDGAWNKGDSGTGYVRFARAFACTLVDPHVRGIRHVAFQWSSAQNRITGGRIEVDVNFHGGYSRYNVVSGTVVAPPRHAPLDRRDHHAAHRPLGPARWAGQPRGRLHAPRHGARRARGSRARRWAVKPGQAVPGEGDLIFPKRAPGENPHALGLGVNPTRCFH